MPALSTANSIRKQKCWEKDMKNAELWELLKGSAMILSSSVNLKHPSFVWNVLHFWKITLKGIISDHRGIQGMNTMDKKVTACPLNVKSDEFSSVYLLTLSELSSSLLRNLISEKCGVKMCKVICFASGQLLIKGSCNNSEWHILNIHLIIMHLRGRSFKFR